MSVQLGKLYILVLTLVRVGRVSCVGWGQVIVEEDVGVECCSMWVQVGPSLLLSGKWKK